MTWPWRTVRPTAGSHVNVPDDEPPPEDEELPAEDDDELLPDDPLEEDDGTTTDQVPASPSVASTRVCEVSDRRVTTAVEVR